MDTETMGLVGFVLLLLIAATVVVSILRRRASASGLDLALLETFRARVRAWWILFTGLAAAFLSDQYLSRYLPGQTVTVILFGLISFWALREFITLTPTRPGDHRALFWVFFLCTPLQFVLVGMEGRWIFNEAHPHYVGFASYAVYSIFIPVYAFLFIPARVAMSGDAKRFLERTAKIQVGLLICVYCLSYAPALLTLEIPASSAPVRLLFFFVLMTQLSDALQYAWSKLPSRHLIVPTISQTRTWEGLLGGAASVTLLGTALWFTTPFPRLWHASLTSLVIALMGFAGGLAMSAIKRDRGVKDFGTLVEGHGGVLDRIDSICFAAPVFFHLTHFLIIG